MDRATFIRAENWYGMYYELCLELGPAGDDGLLAEAVTALWSYPGLRGPWRELEGFGGPPDGPGVGESSHHLYGVAVLDGDTELGCASHVVREDGGSDWLDLCIPEAMLELCFVVQYPLDLPLNPWMRRLDRFFADVGDLVFRADPFQLGIIGVEVSGLLYSATITSEQCEGKILLLPDRLWERLSLRTRHERMESGLVAVGVGGD